MQAIEMPVVEINHQQQIHLQLPHTVRARKAKVIVIYDEPEQSADTLTLASFLNELPDVPTGMGLSREDIAQHLDNERQSWDN
jgi:hypothetical protein